MTPLPESLLESVAAAAVREGLADAIFTRLKTPIGTLLVVGGPEGLVRIAFEGEPEDRALAEVAAALGPNVIGSDREMAAPRDALSEYFEGDTHELDLPVDLRLMHAPFRRAVLEELRLVPRGQDGQLRRARRPRRQPEGRACGRHGVRAQPDPDRRPLPPGAARHGRARQLRRRPGAQARAPGAGRGSLPRPLSP